MKSDSEKHALSIKTENRNSEIPCILLVEDEYDLGSTLSMLLELQGFRTLYASNGQQALDRIALEMQANTLPDLVLSDCMMPIMDGVTLSRQLRANPETSQIPIVLMSAAPQYHDLSKADFDAFIGKPFYIEDLLDTLRRLLPAQR